MESVNVKCGKNGCETEGEENRDCFPILIHQTDPEFPKKPCLMFVRSQASPSDNCKVGKTVVTLRTRLLIYAPYMSVPLHAYREMVIKVQVRYCKVPFPKENCSVMK